MDTNLVSKIKRLTLIALASDDSLVESLVLKGGNAIDLISRSRRATISRTSYDLDYSINDGDFDEEESEISKRIENVLNQTFSENGYIVVDYKFIAKPKHIRESLADFWGGYKVTFKVVDKTKFDRASGVDKNRRASIILNPNSSQNFEIEFSKFEYVGQKTTIDVDHYKIYVYTPEMIVFEKLRAICQQIPEYSLVIPSFTPRPRARDFYDIHLIMEEMHTIDPTSAENVELIANIFRAKRVPGSFIQKIRESKNIHLDNWQSVIDTVSADEKLKDFDYYFDYVLSRFENITIP